MVQVSYPGVYIQEVPSGARTITGVATSITLFVGMAKRGPMDTPTTVLGFTDYSRIFGDDTSQGEMTDQVRQFFLNGGTQAIIMRIALDDAKASVQIPVGTPAITLTSRGSGADENLLRGTVDYNTAEPEKTLNLTVFRELFDASGLPSVGESETLPNLSLDSFSQRFASGVFDRDSVLATAVVNATQVADGDNLESRSFGATILGTGVAAGSFVATWNAALAAGRNQLRITLAHSTGTTSHLITFTTPLANDADVTAIAARIATVVGGGIVFNSAFHAVGANQLLRIGVVNRDITIESGPGTSDIAAQFGLGTSNGGVEMSRGSFKRPRPNGLVSALHDDESTSVYDLIRLLNFAALAKSTLTGAIVVGGETLAPAGKVVFPPGLDVNQGSTTGRSLRNARECLNAIATAINQNTNNWRATVHGYRLVLTQQFGTATNIPGTALTSPADLQDADAIFEGQTTTARASGFGGGADGTPPNAADYNTAYQIIDAKVDLFNLLILPKSANSPFPRTDFWGAASSFCLARRAFLLIDAEEVVDTVPEAGQAVKDLRVGLVKDHAALYWPRVEVNPDGTRRKIDANGSIAGVMSRIDSNRGVWKAPAGLEADIRGALAVTTPMSDPENGLLNPQALNAIRIFPNGIIVWGSRTMDGFDNSGNDDYKYVPVRRFALFIEESLYRGLKFAVFEPNAEPLWSAIRTAVGAFMNNLFRQGAFAGRTTREAYFVKVDSETTTQNDINLGIVNVVVGFAPLKPAEFVVVTIKQQAGQIQV